MMTNMVFSIPIRSLEWLSSSSKAQDQFEQTLESSLLSDILNLEVLSGLESSADIGLIDPGNSSVVEYIEEVVVLEPVVDINNLNKH